MRELRAMVKIGLEETTLLIRRWIALRVAEMGSGLVVIVVCPFCEMVGELQSGNVGGSIFKVYDDELLVLVCRLKKRRLLIIGPQAEDVSILSLREISQRRDIKALLGKPILTSLWANVILALRAV